MPEIDRDKVKAMLAEVPADQQEALLVRLKDRGYTVVPAGEPSAEEKPKGFLASTRRSSRPRCRRRSCRPGTARRPCPPSRGRRSRWAA
jgi:hypothetical protein